MISKNKLEEVRLLSTTLSRRELADKFKVEPDTIRRYLSYAKENAGEIVGKTVPKVLLLDIETLMMTAYLWGTYKQRIPATNIISDWCCLGWSAKWLFSSDIMSDVLTPEEAVKKDDSRILKGIWELMNDGDIIIGHNCVEINTPVLMQNLTWKKAKNLKVGDKLVGFEEGKPPYTKCRDSNNKWIGTKGHTRHIVPTDVTDFSIESRPCVEVHFKNGEIVTTTKDHYWLGMASKDHNHRWYMSSNLKKGHRIIKYANVWDEDKSYEAGWFSGFISGEGTLGAMSRSIDICQRPGSTWNQALDFCDKLEIKRSSNPRTPKGGGLGKQDTLYTGLVGGKWKTLEYIGRLQIKRFIEKIDWNNFGGLKGQNLLVNEVEEVIDVGNKDVAVFSTSSKTFIGAGYPMHNCDKFDIRKLNARFIINGMQPPMPYQTIDTLKVARKYFAFSSYTLNYLCKMFDLATKLHTDYDLWKKSYVGDLKSLTYMEEYNRQDIVALEDLYVKLRPYIKGHPNMGVFVDTTEQMCTNCGSHNLVWEGEYTTSTSRYKAFRCKDCGAIGRNRFMNMDADSRKNLIVPIAR